MGHPDYVTCKRCGRHRDECGPLSWSRLCTKCAIEKVAANLEGLATFRGPEFEKWAKGLTAFAGILPLDNTPVAK